MARNTAYLEPAAGLLALVVAAVHLYWGIPRFVAYASVGTMPDPRPLAFVLSGHAILGVITLVVLGAVDARRTYLPGMALMLAHLVGYAAWHTVLAHGATATAGATDSAHGHVHLGNAAPIVLEHLANSPLALVSKLTELTVLLLLGVVYVGTVRDRHRSAGPNA